MTSRRSFIRCDLGEAGVVRLVLDRPERKNAVDREMIAELDGRLEALAGAGVRALVIEGAPGVFCAGWDTEDIRALTEGGREDAAAAFRANEETLEKLARFPAPTVAAVDGAVIGFGFTLLARCDFVVASARTRIELPELKYGLTPAAVLGDVVRIFGPRRAFEILTLCEPVGVQEAHGAGLVTRIAREQSYQADVQAFIDRLVRRPANAVRTLKALVREASVLSPSEMKEVSIAAAVDAVLSPEAQRLIPSKPNQGGVKT